MINPIQALADSSAWKAVRDSLIAEKLADLKDVTKPVELPNEMKVTPNELTVGKIIASHAVEAIINEIDIRANSKREKPINKFD